MYNLDDYLLENDEKLSESIDYLQQWKEQPLAKIEKVADLVKTLEYQNEDIDKELDRLREKKKQNEKKITNAKNYIMSLIPDSKPTRAGTYTFSIRHSQAVEILDESKVPDEFKEQKITYTISKTKIKDFLSKDIIDTETGEVLKNECSWAKIKNNMSLTIK